ncbi:MAG: prolyl oligopeptidase family serine peptidase [Nocardioides sp.]|uniref:S9 family peptidase n=1 Tax=Nocardioides sp. TaxID=35761 RepID=UPI0039E692D8
MTTTAAYLALRAPLHASVTPDGDRIALTVTSVPVGADEPVVELLVLDTRSLALSPAPGATAGDHSGVWSPDGTALAFLGKRDGQGAVVVSKPAEAESLAIDDPARLADTVTVYGDLGEPTSPPAWSPDGRFLALAARSGAVIDRSRPYRWTRPIPAFDGLGPLEDPPQLVLLDLVAGSSRVLTEADASVDGGGWRWSGPTWSPDGRRLAATVSIDPAGRRSGSHLRLVDLGEPAQRGADAPARIEEPAVPGGRTLTLAWRDDDHLLALVAEPKDQPLGSPPRMWQVTAAGAHQCEVDFNADPGVDGAEIELLGDVYGDQPAELADDPAPAVSPIGPDGLLVRTGCRGRLGVGQLTVAPPASFGRPAASPLLHPERETPEGETLSWRPFLDGDRCLSPFAVAGGQVFLTVQTADQPVDLWAVPLPGPGSAETLEEVKLRRLTRFAEGAPAAAPVRRTHFRAEGRELDLWFLGDPGRPLPTVVLVHGGPQFAFGEAFNLDAQALCAAGFGVLYTNVRGSTGYGAEFGGAIRGDWAEGPTRDLLAAVDHAVELGWADPERLGVAGNSYGGYLATWLASTTDRFRAAVAENPVTDLVSMASTSDIAVPFFAQQMGGELHEIPATYLEQSPALHAHRCRTPLLFVIGADDRRCPNHQAWGMHRLVHRTGTPTEVLVLPDSPHEGSTYGPIAGRLAHDEALVDWLTRFLL